jgi:hypothetical protein
MFLMSELASWLDAAGISTPMYFDGQDWDEILEDQAVILTPTGGPPSLDERTFDQPTVQILTRGSQFDPGSAEKLAASVDDAILLPASTFIGTTYVSSMDRLGGPPRLLSRDAARRNVFSCNYIFQAARSTF